MLRWFTHFPHQAAVSRFTGNLAICLAAVLCSTAMADDNDSTEDKWDVNAPPGQLREIAIDTRTGTWISLDVSPDGSQIAFDLLGDIYLLPIDGGQARAIESGLAWSMQPRFSPDGSEIAFTSDAGGGDNIWIMQADGSDPRQLTNETFRLLNNPAWSPDGDYIAARKHFTTQRSLGTGEIWLYHRNGGTGVAVIEKPSEDHQKELGEPAFSPDGRHLYYSLDSTPGARFQYAQDSNGQIFEIRRHDLKTGETRRFVTGAGGAVRPTPSPDGRYLAFVRRIRAKSALFVKDLESGEERALYEHLDQDMQEVWAVHGVYPNMDWTPDSRELVFWAGGELQRINVASGERARIPFHVTDTRSVMDAPRPAVKVAPAQFNSRMIRNAAVSPDGAQAVFESAGRLYIKRLPDGEPKLLTGRDSDNFEFFPSWSPDSRSVVFVAWNDRELGQIHRVRAGGGRSQQLTRRPGHYRTPRLSPDGQRLVFEAANFGALASPAWSVESGVFVMDLDSAAVRLVTADGSNPQFGADSERLFVTRAGEGGEGLALVSINLDGEAARTHASGKLVTHYAVAPDGRHFAFRENYQVFALPLPPGGQSLSLSTSTRSVPAVKASGDGGNFAHWTNGGSTLRWTLGANLYQADVEQLFALKPENAEGYKAPVRSNDLSVRHDADVPDGRLALVGARVITMNDKDGGVIDNAVILVEGNRISTVGTADEVRIPDGTARVELGGKTIIPGIIDAHAHGPQGNEIIVQQNWVNYATLALGVTTVHDPSNDAREVFAASEMQRMGRILAPRIFSTGDIVYGAKASVFADINSLEDARHHVRRLKVQGAHSIKNYNQPRREQRQQVVAAAREEGMLVVAEGGSLFHMDLSMVADGNSTIEHNLPQSMLYDDVLQFWEQTNVAYTPTFVVTYGGPAAENYWYQHTEVWKHPLLTNFVPPHILQPRAVRRTMAPDEDYYHVRSGVTAGMLAARGVPVSIGAHGQREGLASHWEMWTFAQAGMSAIEVLHRATTDPARALGFDQDLGSIEPGKLADLVVIDADILENIYASDKVSMVMLNGRLYDAATLNETVTGERKTLPFYWQ